MYIAHDSWSKKLPKVELKNGVIVTVLCVDETKRARKHYLVRCPVCKKDKDMPDAGIFSIERISLKNGVVPCRCSPRHHWTDSQNKVRLLRLLESTPYDILSVENKDVTLSCPTHGPWSSTVQGILKGTRCPLCAGKNQKQAYINLVVDDGVAVAIKLGISKEWEVRLSNQNSKNFLKSENIGVWEFLSPNLCKDAENECKQTLKTGVLSAREMKDGWTETVSVLDLEKVIAIYEKHGGKRIK